MKKKPTHLTIITGQTATGKTKLASHLAQNEVKSAEIINADSRHIYKHLNVVTGKDLAVFKSAKIPTHLFDIADPKEYFSSYDYKKRATSVILDIIKRDKEPIVVGGTYFYIRHLIYGISTEGIGPDWNLRYALEKKTVRQLQSILKKHSPKTFNSLNNSDQNNPRRLIRQIEIAISRKSWKDESSTSQPINITTLQLSNIQMIGLRFEKKGNLAKIIKKRVGERISLGAIEETEKLLRGGYEENDPGLQTIGYRQLIAYLKGECTKEVAIADWITKEIQYARRQYMFMKKDENIKWKYV